jgi:hypothetical protein
MAGPLQIRSKWVQTNPVSFLYFPKDDRTGVLPTTPPRIFYQALQDQNARKAFAAALIDSFSEPQSS